MSFNPAAFLAGSTLTSEYVKTAGPFQATILGADTKTFKNNETGKDEVKPILLVRLADGDQKDLVLSKTKLRQIMEVYGADPSLWTGREIGVAYDPNVMFGARRVGGVVLRFRQQGPAPAVAAVGQVSAGQDIPF